MRSSVAVTICATRSKLSRSTSDHDHEVAAASADVGQADRCLRPSRLRFSALVRYCRAPRVKQRRLACDRPVFEDLSERQLAKTRLADRTR
jgi:hypothetical protein